MTKAPLYLPDPEVERELYALVRRERLARDTGDFDLLSLLYWPDSLVRVTWFSGTIAEFIEISRDSHSRGRGRGIHVINPVRCYVQGHRATVESQGEIHIRPKVGETFCDVVSWCRFFSRLEKRNGEWRIKTFDSIYCKDRIDTVNPTGTLHLDTHLLNQGRASYRHLTYLNKQAGFTVPDDLPGDDRPDLVAQFYADARDWVLCRLEEPDSHLKSEKLAVGAGRFRGAEGRPTVRVS